MDLLYGWLKTYAGQEIQGWLQNLLEQEIPEFLGLGKSANKAAANEQPGYCVRTP